MITSLIFDFGGVLIDWNPRHLYRRYFSSPDEMEQFLAEVDFAGWNIHQDRGRPFTEGVRELTARFPHRAGLIRAFHEHWEDSVGGPIEGSLQILREVKKLGYPVYGLSNWSAETFPRARARFNIFDLLDDYMLSGDVCVVKPDPLIFQLALEKFGRRAEECLFIDDSLPNIATASAFGMPCIHFQSPPQLEKELIQLGIFKRVET
jgi:2-haloacid dehalogenase